MPNNAKPSQTTHNYYWEHIESFKTIFKKTSKKRQKNVTEEEDESSIKSRLNKRQALEATKNYLLPCIC